MVNSKKRLTLFSLKTPLLLRSGSALTAQVDGRGLTLERGQPASPSHRPCMSVEDSRAFDPPLPSIVKSFSSPRRQSGRRRSDYSISQQLLAIARSSQSIQLAARPRFGHIRITLTPTICDQKEMMIRIPARPGQARPRQSGGRLKYGQSLSAGPFDGVAVRIAKRDVGDVEKAEVRWSSSSCRFAAFAKECSHQPLHLALCSRKTLLSERRGPRGGGRVSDDRAIEEQQPHPSRPWSGLVFFHKQD